MVHLFAQVIDDKLQRNQLEAAQPDLAKFVMSYCLDCHKPGLERGNLALDQLLDESLAKKHREVGSGCQETSLSADAAAWIASA